MAWEAAETEHPRRLRTGGDKAGSGNATAPGVAAGQRRPASDSVRCRDTQVGADGAAGTSVIHLPASVRVYLCISPCDMRRSFDGLHALVTGTMKLDAFAGHLFVFANRRKDRVKILYWDRDGFAVWAKRLEEGTYAMPFGTEDEAQREVTAQELGALLSGIDLSTAKRRKRYRRGSVEAA
jgi:transposase